MANESVLRMENITKIFPGVVALDDVTFAVKRGEVHCLVGQNGAGKSTLIKIMAGALPMDKGAIFLDGKRVVLSDPHTALQMGISVLYQEFALNPYFDVAENIFMGREPKRAGFIDYARMHAAAEELLMPFGVAIDVRRKIQDLSVAHQQIVALAKALSFQAKVIVFDEPSAVLTLEELRRLFQIIRGLRERGVGIVYISHRLEEIFEIGDRVTVLRDGKVVGTHAVGEVDEARLVRMMIGRELEADINKPEPHRERRLLEVEDLCVMDSIGPCSFSVGEGEVVGIFGLVGAGRTELLKGLFGALPITGGEVRFEGRPVSVRSTSEAIDLGIGLVPESRKEEGLILGLDVEKNLTLCLWKIMQIAGFLQRKALHRVHDEYVRKLSIKTAGFQQEVKNLSGGNQQKVVLAKWLARKCKILILDEPTRGIDVGAKREIYHLIMELANQGLGIIMISSELSEIINLSHRILVMRKGRIVGEYQAEEADEEIILTRAMGVCSNGGKNGGQ